MDIDSNINKIFLDNTLELDDSKYLFKNNIQLFDYQKQTISTLLNHERGQMKITIPLNYLNILESEFVNKDYTFTNNFARDVKRYQTTRDQKFLFKNNMNLVDKFHIEANFGYNIGILSNTVGSGKTLVILGFIMRNKFFKKNILKLSYKKNIYNNSYLPGDICDVISEFLVEKDSFSLSIDYSSLKNNNNLFLSRYYKNYEDSKKTIIKTNLIIVPHNLFEQWKNEINRTFLKTKYIKDKRNLKDIENDILTNNYDIILCNVNKVIQLLEFLPNKKYNFERIFIDEVDIINLPKFPELNTNFLWLITTTYTRILNPKNIGFINNLFRSNYFPNNTTKSFYKFFLEKLTFSFNTNYIQQKLKLTIPNKNFIIVPNNFINTLFYNLKCKSYYKFLNSYDYESLYYYILKSKSRHMIKYILRFLIFNSLGKEIYPSNNQNMILNLLTNFTFDFENNSSIFFIFILFRLHHINYDLINRKISPRMRYIKSIILQIKSHYLNCPICKNNNNIMNFNLYDHDIENLYVKNKKKNVKSNLEGLLDNIGLLNSIDYMISCTDNAKIEKCPTNVNFLQDQLKYKTFSVKKTFRQLKKEIDELYYIKAQLLNNNYCLKCMNIHKSNNCIETNFLNFFSIVDINFSNFINFTPNIFNNYQEKFIREIQYEDFNLPNINNIIENNKNTKIENMLISLKKDILNNKRCLVFSDNNYFFKNIKLELDNHSITNRTLKGNTNTINSIIRKYKKHEIKVLLLNMKHCGSGINLEMSDNIYIMNFLDSQMETQVIGRVNRIGKKNDLNVNYYLTTHEYSFYKNIISSDTKSNIIIEEI